MHEEKFTGFRTIFTPTETIEDLHQDGKILIWDRSEPLFPNMYVELKDLTDDKFTALGRVTADNRFIERIQPGQVSGLHSRNREQAFTIDAISRDEITTVVLTGRAGTGKTIVTLASSLQLMQSGKFRKIVITRPMSYVGKYALGALPGDADEKFSPYLLNYTTNMEELVGKRLVADLMSQYKFEIVPLQLLRGASFNGCLVIADEMQVCDYMEILTVGTRIGEGSKLIIMGDLDQRDEKIDKEKTGLFKLINSPTAQNSPLLAAIELQRCERSVTAKLFSDIFEE